MSRISPPMTPLESLLRYYEPVVREKTPPPDPDLDEKLKKVVRY